MSLTALSTDELMARLGPEARRSPATGDTEHRSLAIDDFQIRAAGNDLVLKGYASVFEHRYDILGGPDVGGWTELVDRRAFDQTLKQRPDVQLLVNHEGTPLARTERANSAKPATLFLTTDAKGLHVEAKLDTKSPVVQTIRSAMERGDMDEMSFAFRTVRQEFDEATSERRLLEVNIHKGDVSVVNYGASDATSAQLRFAQQLERFASLGPAEFEKLARDIPPEALEQVQANVVSLFRARRSYRRLSVADAEASTKAPRY